MFFEIINPNIKASLITCLLPFVLYLPKYGRFIFKVIGVALVAYFFITAAYTNLIIVAYFLLYKQINKWYYLLLIVLIPIAFIYSNSLMGRLLIWKITIIQNNKPIVGNGVNSFKNEYGNLKVAYFSNHHNTNEIQLVDESDYCFNEMIQLYYEGGLVSILILLFIITILMIVVWHLYKHNKTVIKPILLSLVSIFTNAQLLYNLHNFWIFIILMVNIFCILFLYLKRNKLYILVLSFIFICVLTFISIVNYRKQVNNNNLFYAVNTCQIDVVRGTNLKDTYNDGELMYKYASCLTNHTNINTAIAILKSYTDKYINYKVCILLGDFLFNKNHFSQAKYYYYLAHLCVPNRFLPLFNIFKIYEFTGDSINKNIYRQLILNKPIKIKSSQIDYYLKYVKAR